MRPCARCWALTSRRRARSSHPTGCDSTFRTYSAVTPDELAVVERLVNEEIRGNAAAETRLMKYDDAVAAGAMALFGEKYDDDVRVLRIR